MIYLDNAATSPLTQKAMDAMTQVMTSNLANPSSIHAYGRKASQALRLDRQLVANYFQTNPRNIVFTSGGSESNNTAIKGYALRNQDKGKHLITSQIEHHAVLHVMEYLENRFGFEVTYLEPINGSITPDQVKDALREDTILVSLMYANNETGALLPIAEIGQNLAQHQAVFHVDAVQAVGKLAIHPEELGIDLLSASAHKFHGPKGVGILYQAPHILLDNLLHGGEQEEKRRASTENLIGIAGMAAALDEASQHLQANYDYISQLREHFLKELEGLDYYLNSPEDSLPHVINLGFPAANNGALLTRLDLLGIAVSTGSACTAGTVDPSHVLAAMYGKTSARLQESIRVSLSELNTKEELSQLAQALHQILGD
ncbi:aminotransferase class V-fold PLP-dependent enzyme [Streptococcus loxodontisalivarius]|uniref:cysteine desulfurase n=1 Tax=Streptococcus loxodontisalivarius TaxID=1349415 RepID=A0ABS2PS17_9STRE|nr:cysteine desulfurase [Streptococcus loxodontisalivarius]